MHKHPAQPANSQPIDQQARRSAIDPHTSFAVAAPAGSGKTGLLTQRVLSLLAHAEHPEEVLSITFTRKAAAEMQERIISAIASAAATPQMPDDAHAAFTWKLAQQVIKRDKLKHWQLLQSPNRLRIQTIDGFCRSLARQLPLASGLGALPQTLDQPELAYAQAVLDLFEQMEGEADTFSHWQTVLAYLDNNLPRLQQLLQTLLAKRDQWLPNLHPIFSQTLLAKEQTPKNFNASALQAWIEEVLTDIDTKLTAHASELALLGDYAASNLGADAKTDLSALLGATGLPTTTSEGLASWQQLASLLTTASGWRKRLDKNIGFISPKEKHEKALATERKQALMAIIGELQQQPGLLEQLLLLKTLPSPDSTDKAQTIIASLSYLLVLLAAQLKVVFRKLGATDFIEVSQAALQALGEEDEPSQIALQLDYQIRHILVDEFQDTAGPQLRLLEKLTAGWEVGDGRTLFIVGDGMQSCYGFREANVGLFLQAREKGIGTVKLQALDLQVNFRSQAGVVNWVNQVFEHAFPARNDIGRGAVSYAHSVAFKAELQGPACQLKIFAQDPDFPNQQQAQVLAEQVAKLRAELPDDSVAILVRNRSHLATVLPALAAQGLSWQATDIDPLASRMVIQDLLNLTQALLYPSDRLALLSVLRSPLLGLDLKQLWSLSNWPDGETKPLAADGYKRPLLIEQLLQKQFASQLEKGQAKRLSHFCKHWCAAQQNYGRKPLRIWVEGLWLALGGPATLLEPAELNNVESFFDLLGAEGYILDSWQSFKDR
ncbi:MAG: UvrD-helicase domain-containing protein, partial [Cellvibrionaceae bacterium]|nr:UvrD-helicase domain-containing protein [Cellvibrionaceae bacterium]